MSLSYRLPTVFFVHPPRIFPKGMHFLPPAASPISRQNGHLTAGALVGLLRNRSPLPCRQGQRIPVTKRGNCGSSWVLYPYLRSIEAACLRGHRPSHLTVASGALSKSVAPPKSPPPQKSRRRWFAASAL
ncbi:hypothetical protein HMPREF0262_01694 [Clostridium sp. ATCC 29733]|nr:hypothetical protein HMPREF0262_01694 [Clostridium sp. ATCC 29733]